MRINWPGRIAVGPTMFGLWLALLGAGDVDAGFLYGGARAGGWVAAAGYCSGP